MFPRKTGVREATLLLLKEKCGRYAQLRVSVNMSLRGIAIRMYLDNIDTNVGGEYDVTDDNEYKNKNVTFPNITYTSCSSNENVSNCVCFFSVAYIFMLLCEILTQNYFLYFRSLCTLTSV